MKTLLSHVLTLTEKDIRLELRSKSTLFASLLLLVLLLCIFSFSFSTSPDILIQLAPGMLWVLICFSGTILITNISHRDEEDSAAQGLLMTGVSGMAFFFSKFITTLWALMLMELIAVPLFVVFFNFPVTDNMALMSMALSLGTIGFAALGVLFSSLLQQVKFRELFLPIVFYPVMIPFLIVAVQAMKKILQGETPKEIMILLGFDIIIVTACALLFEFVVEDPS